MIRMLSAGESHGTGISVIIDGMPAGLKIKLDFINNELLRRQAGYGRSVRMKIEFDCAEIISGIRCQQTIGSPIGIFVRNQDYRAEEFMNSLHRNNRFVSVPRPGHADLAGFLKYGLSDIQDVIERASARETVARVAAGAIFKLFLNEFSITIGSRMISVGLAKGQSNMKKIIDETRAKGDTLGGVVEVFADNVCPGLGSYTQFDKRLDARIGMVMLSIPSVKGVEIGDAIRDSYCFGSEVQDQIFYDKKNGLYRKTNHAGGIEGGVSNGAKIVIRLYVKPIPTLRNPLTSVDLRTKEKVFAPSPRADVCAVESVGVIAESMLAYVLADTFCEKFGSDNLDDIKAVYKQYIKRIKNV